MADSYRSVVVTITASPTGTPKTMRIIADGAGTDCVAELSPEYAATIASDPYWGNVGVRVTALVRNPEVPLVTGGVA